MSIVTLSEISEINEHTKDVLKESRRLYRVSLNAMFASRRINVGIDGFIEVTSLLRDFSDQLNSQVIRLSSSVNQAIYYMVLLSRAKNRIRLTDLAVKLAGRQFTTSSLNQHVNDLTNKSELIVTKINSEIGRCLRLIQVGENLTVLAKVEANSVPVHSGDLDTITNDMDGIMLSINSNIMDTRSYISHG